MRAPKGLPSVLLIRAKKSGGVELWLALVQRHETVLHSVVVVALLLVDKANVMLDGAGLLLHLGGALKLSECGIVLTVVIESNAQATVDEKGQRIELKSAPHVSDGILRAAYGVEVNCVLEFSNGVAGIEGDPAFEILFRCSPIPRVNSLDAAEFGVGFAVLGVELDGALGSGDCFGHELFGRTNVVGRGSIERGGIAGVCGGVAGIECNGLLEGLEAVREVLLIKKVAAAQISVVRGWVDGSARRGRGEDQAGLGGDLLGDAVLEGEDIGGGTFEGLGPEVSVGASVDELGGDADSVAGADDGAFNDGVDVELTGDIGEWSGGSPC